MGKIKQKDIEDKHNMIDKIANKIALEMSLESLQQLAYETYYTKMDNNMNREQLLEYVKNNHPELVTTTKETQ